VKIRRSNLPDEGSSMLKLDNVGEVIASRELTLDGTAKVTVLIGKPRYEPAPVDWYCPYQTVGVGSGRVRCAYGGDSVQALVLALSLVGAQLYCSAEYEAGRLSWDYGAVKGDLGFPVPPNIQDVLPPGAGVTPPQQE
jgi:hypothetical protein